MQTNENPATNRNLKEIAHPEKNKTFVAFVTQDGFETPENRDVLRKS